MVEVVAAKHHLLANLIREFVERAYRRDGKANRFLQTVLHVAPCLEGTIARSNGVSAGADMIGIAGMEGQGLECLERNALGKWAELVVYRVDVIIAVDVNILGLAALREGRETVDVAHDGDDCDAAYSTIQIELRK